MVSKDEPEKIEEETGTKPESKGKGKGKGGGKPAKDNKKAKPSQNKKTGGKAKGKGSSSTGSDSKNPRGGKSFDVSHLRFAATGGQPGALAQGIDTGFGQPRVCDAADPRFQGAYEFRIVPLAFNNFFDRCKNIFQAKLRALELAMFRYSLAQRGPVSNIYATRS